MHQQVNALVATALRQSRLSGLSEMLKSIAEAMKAYGSILWQVAPGSEIEARRGNLQVLAEWFPDNQSSALYTLPLDRSLTGEALATQRAQSVRDVRDPRVYDDPFFTQAGIQTFCSLPLRFADESRGALNLYRNAPKQPFVPSELKVGERLAALVPQLYQAIRDRVSFDLIHQVHEALHDAEISSPDQPLGIEAMRQVLEKLCRLVSDAFQCIETSVFLEDKLRTPDVYELAASTWPFPISKRTYSSDPKDGLTGWTLAQGKVVNLPNLSRFKEDQPTIQSEYPGLTWNDPLDLELSVRSLWPDLARGWLPLSFMAVPVVRADRVVGAIRCSVAKRCPYSFAGHEVDLLSLVAAQVGRSWSSWLNRREIEEENHTWKGLVESIQKLNRYVLAELSKSELSENRIFSEALRVTSSLIAGAEIVDIRLLDEKQKELYFAETHGAAWGEGEPEVLQKRRDKRFPVGNPEQRSAGARVVETGEVYMIEDVSKEEFYSETFPDTKRMIVAPMVSFPDGKSSKPKVLGVLDIRGTDAREFPRHARDIAGLLGSQLGLYHDLATTIGEMNRLQREQVQIFQDLKHQLKTPMGQAHKRIGLVLKLPLLAPTIEEHLRKVRGLVAKAMRVNMNTGLFASLARGESLKPNISPLTARDLIKLLIEAGMDNQLMVEARRQINFEVDRGGFEQFGELKVDRELLEQAIYDLLDNAYKYSDAKTVIRILGGPTRGGFQIRIVNTGIPIETYEIPHCVERGWQSEAARSVSGSGSGIGLWIVDHIMKAHGGELQIMPTRSNRETEIRLLFPLASFR